MEILKLIVVIFGATGFWKLVEIILKLRIDKRLKKAETSSLYAQANSQIVENWVGWSQKLENRVKELEEHITKLEKRNRELSKELEELKKEKHGNR